MENHQIANLISKLNFYKLIPYPMDKCYSGQRDRPAGPSTSALARWRVEPPSCIDSVTS